MLKISCVAIAALVVLGGCGPSEKELAAQKTAAVASALREQLTNSLKDPGAVQIRNEKIAFLDQALCGEMNGKNSLGAYAGFRRFVVVDNVGVFIEGERGELPDTHFLTFWDLHCRLAQ